MTAKEIQKTLEGATIARVRVNDDELEDGRVSICALMLTTGEVFSFEGESLYYTAVIELDQRPDVWFPDEEK